MDQTSQTSGTPDSSKRQALVKKIYASPIILKAAMSGYMFEICSCGVIWATKRENSDAAVIPVLAPDEKTRRTCIDKHTTKEDTVPDQAPIERLELAVAAIEAGATWDTEPV